MRAAIIFVEVESPIISSHRQQVSGAPRADQLNYTWRGRKPSPVEGKAASRPGCQLPIHIEMIVITIKKPIILFIPTPAELLYVASVNNMWDIVATEHLTH